ncbi:hypothetical protein [Caulobacter sp. DWP3-1-3b2]|uniref:hypothetical protein n=1 Tax=Caulobacter sp. DWP3-1-3b2 TaxID=2804643 RepID=UPI003CF8EC6F
MPNFSNLPQTRTAPPVTMRDRPAHDYVVCFPRLMNGKQAAAYLGYKSADFLKNIGITPIRLAEGGRGSAPRFDRLALDLHLDSLSNIDGRKELTDVEDEAESDFEKWERSHAVRH